MPDTTVVAQPPASAAPPGSQGWWPQGWWRIVDYRIGILPLPVFVLLVGLIAFLSGTREMKPDLPVAIALLSVGGFACAELGKRIPIIRNFGAAAIFATFIPSYLAFRHVLPEPVEKAVADFVRQSNYLYLFIACIIVGSILGMDRQVLMRGFLKIFVPLAVGSLVAGAVGTLVGTALGLGTRHTLLFIVVPIMAGGVGEGAIPLSLGYSEILHLPQGDLFATVLPPVMLGSFFAIVLAGLLNQLGRLRPQWTGNGQLQPGGDHALMPGEAPAAPDAVLDPATIAAAGVTAVTLYLLGVACHELFGLPAPVAMLFLAVLAKLTRAVSPRLQQGGAAVYRFFQVAVTYPLLFGIGIAITPWDKLMAAFTLPYLITVFCTVATLMVCGAFIGRAMGMYPIESALVNACHSGQGGTGDVAILSAADRMALMPFAQIATRIGGAVTVTLVLIGLARFG